MLTVVPRREVGVSSEKARHPQRVNDPARVAPERYLNWDRLVSRTSRTSRLNFWSTGFSIRAVLVSASIMRFAHTVDFEGDFDDQISGRNILRWIVYKENRKTRQEFNLSMLFMTRPERTDSDLYGGVPLWPQQDISLGLSSTRLPG